MTDNSWTILNVNNYRLISIISAITKVFERIVYDQTKFTNLSRKKLHGDCILTKFYKYAKEKRFWFFLALSHLGRFLHGFCLHYQKFSSFINNLQFFCSQRSHWFRWSSEQISVQLMEPQTTQNQALNNDWKVKRWRTQHAWIRYNRYIFESRVDETSLKPSITIMKDNSV